MPIIKIVSLYAESHLPKRGWLQACIMCETKTSKTRLDRTITNSQDKIFEIFIYLCPRCQQKLSDAEFYSKYKSVIQNMLDGGDISLD